MSQPVGASGGSYLMNSAPDDSLSLAFQGTQIAIEYIQGPSFGSFAVELDGTIVQQVGSNAPVYEFNDQFTVSGLSDGPHVLRILTVQGVVAIDAFRIQGSVAAAPETLPPPSITSTQTDTDTATLNPTATPTLEVSVPATPIPLLPPITATMDDGAADWQGTEGWSLTPDASYRGSGLSWQLMTSGAPESLRWTSAIDLRNVLPSQFVQLSFASRLQLTSGTAQLELSTDGGSQWVIITTVAPSEDWSSTVVDVSAFAGQVIELEFVWTPDPKTSDSSTATYWGVDQVSIQVADLVMATPIPSATLTPTDLPTDTPTNIPTEMPTDIPTDIPTENADGCTDGCADGCADGYTD